MMALPWKRRCGCPFRRGGAHTFALPHVKLSPPLTGGQRDRQDTCLPRLHLCQIPLVS